MTKIFASSHCYHLLFKQQYFIFAVEIKPEKESKCFATSPFVILVVIFTLKGYKHYQKKS